MDTVREPLVLVSIAGDIIMANPAFCALSGTPIEGLTGRSLSEVAGGAWSNSRVRALLTDAAAADGVIRDVELITQVIGGPLRTLLLNARRLVIASVAHPAILIAAEDITERQRLDHALRVTVEELERSNHDLEAFASVASHDLQEPLRKIRAFGERLESTAKDSLSPESKTYLSRILSAAERMQRLIGSLLALARVGERSSMWGRVDLNTLMVEVLRDLEDALTRTGGRVDVGVLPEIDGDPTNFAQLFQNLIGNGLKFHGADAPLVQVSARQIPPEGFGEPARKWWEIVVADNGIGFEPEHAERIFRPLERLHPRGVYEGAGLGLALCRRIVQRHGGTIRSESPPQGGARFIIGLPAQRQDRP